MVPGNGFSQESTINGKADDGVVLVAALDVNNDVESECAKGASQLHDVGAEHQEGRQAFGHRLGDLDDVDHQSYQGEADVCAFPAMKMRDVNIKSMRRSNLDRLKRQATYTSSTVGRLPAFSFASQSPIVRDNR